MDDESEHLLCFEVNNACTDDGTNQARYETIVLIKLIIFVGVHHVPNCFSMTALLECLLFE